MVVNFCLKVFRTWVQLPPSPPKGYKMSVTQCIIEENDDESESKRNNKVFVLPVHCVEHYG